MPTTLRIATPEDAASIQGIYAPYVTDTAITFEVSEPTVEEMRKRIKNKLESYPWIVAEDDGRVIGYAYAGPLKGRAAYDWSVETSIYVDRNVRGKGTGKMLYQKLEELLKRMGIVSCFACIAYTEDDGPYLTGGSVAFHEKLGYERVGLFRSCANKFDTWWDVCWMQKDLVSHEKSPSPVVPFSKLHR